MSAVVIPIREAVLSPRDEADLRIYFALELPPPPGTQSSFGPMCERVSNSRNPKTKELPSEGVPWTDIIECSWGRSSTHDGEDAFIAYVDARRFVKRVHIALSRLTEHEREVLRAHYTELDLAPLTPTAERENRERAATERHESVATSVTHLNREAKDMRASKASRDDTRAKLTAIRREVAEMLQEARAAYSRTR